MTLTISDFAAIAGLMIGLVGLPGSLMLLMLKRMADNLDAVRLDVHKRHIEINERFAELERDKTDRREWIRDVLESRDKQDEVLQQLATLQGKMDTQSQFGAAVTRIANALDRNGNRGGGGNEKRSTH